MRKCNADRIVMLDENGVFIGFVSIHTAIGLYLDAARPKQTKLGTDVKRDKKAVFSSGDVKMSDIPNDDFIVCTRTGNSRDPVIGVYIK